MRSSFLSTLLAITTMVIVHDDAFGQALSQSLRNAGADAPADFNGEKTSWHGFDRFDFLMDEKELNFHPIKADSDDGTGVNGQVEGQLRCVVVAPNEVAPGKPWSWRGRYFDHEP